jgi:MFS family permease
MIPLRLFASREFSAGNAASFFLSAAVYGTLFFLPQFLQVAQHDDAFGAGLRILPWTATLFVFAPIAGAVIDRVGERPVIVVGLAAQAAGNVWLAAIATPGVPYEQLVAPLILAGAGVSLAMPATQRIILNSAPRADMGKASGTFTMVRYLGGMFGVALLATVFTHSGGFASAQAFGAGFTPVMWGAAAFSLLATCAAWALPQPQRVAAATAASR